MTAKFVLSCICYNLPSESSFRTLGAMLIDQCPSPFFHVTTYQGFFARNIITEYKKLYKHPRKYHIPRKYKTIARIARKSTEKDLEVPFYLKAGTDTWSNIVGGGGGQAYCFNKMFPLF